MQSHLSLTNCGRRGVIIQDLVCEEKDFEFNSGFNKEPKKRREYSRVSEDCVLLDVEFSSSLRGSPKTSLCK